MDMKDYISHTKNVHIDKIETQMTPRGIMANT